MNDDIYLTYSADLGFREQRIQELLSNSAHVRPAGAKISAADMSAYQYDHSSKEAQRLLPFLFAAAAARPDLVTPQMADALEPPAGVGRGHAELAAVQHRLGHRCARSAQRRRAAAARR